VQAVRRRWLNWCHLRASRANICVFLSITRRPANPGAADRQNRHGARTEHPSPVRNPRPEAVKACGHERGECLGPIDCIAARAFLGRRFGVDAIAVQKAQGRQSSENAQWQPFTGGPQVMSRSGSWACLGFQRSRSIRRSRIASGGRTKHPQSPADKPNSPQLQDLHEERSGSSGRRNRGHNEEHESC
jgi:hypothetical protein